MTSAQLFDFFAQLKQIYQLFDDKTFINRLIEQVSIAVDQLMEIDLTPYELFIEMMGDFPESPTDSDWLPMIEIFKAAYLKQVRSQWAQFFNAKSEKGALTLEEHQQKSGSLLNLPHEKISDCFISLVAFAKARGPDYSI